MVFFNSLDVNVFKLYIKQKKLAETVPVRTIVSATHPNILVNCFIFQLNHNSERRTSAKQQISGRLSMLVWAFPLASQHQTRHEKAKSMNCAMLGISLLMPLFEYNSNIDIG